MEIRSETIKDETITTDPKSLHKQFVEWGAQRHKLKNKMLLILPEIYASNVWRKYSATIIEYAGKYGDIARSTVVKRLRLEQNLEGKPELRKAIEQAGVHKVAMVAKLATPEMDRALAEKVVNMSKAAVQILSKELRQRGKERSGLFDGGELIDMNQQGYDLQMILEAQAISSAQVVPNAQAVPQTIRLELDEEMTFLFLKIKKEIGGKMSNKEVMKRILKKALREEESTISRKIGGKNRVKSKSVTGDTSPQNAKRGVGKSRYIPVAKRRQISNQANGRCAYPGCNCPQEIWHHTERFCENKSHESVIPLCKAHHEFMHNNLILNEEAKPDKWRMKRLDLADDPFLSSLGDVLRKNVRIKIA